MNDVFSRLVETMNKATDEGWKNITHEELCKSFHLDQLTVLKNAGLRDHLSSFSIFRQIVSNDLINHIVIATNANYAEKKASKQGKKSLFSFSDILLFISMIVDVCSLQIISFVDYLNDGKRTIGLSTSRYNKVRKYIAYDNKTAYDLFNVGIKSDINVLLFSSLFHQFL